MTFEGQVYDRGRGAGKVQIQELTAQEVVDRELVMLWDKLENS